MKCTHPSDTGHASPRAKIGSLGWLTFLTVVLVYTREFPGPDGPPSFLYDRIPGALGARWVDVGVLAVVSFFLMYRALQANTRWTVNRGVRQGLGLFGLATALSIGYGLANGGSELFYEWRNVALGLAVAFMARQILERLSPPTALRVLFTLLAGRGVWLLARWLLNGGVEPFGGPIWDGPTLSSLVAATALGVALLHLADSLGPRGVIVLLATAASATVVIAAFRRTYWIELAVLFGVLLLAARRQSTSFRWRLSAVTAGLAVMVVIMSTLAAIPAEIFMLRVQSVIAPLDTTNTLADTNSFHIADVQDAIDIIKESPIFGIGQGRPYRTQLLAPWIPESWGVHNAILHVWLRFGLLGLVAYLWFHFSVFRWLWHTGASSRVLAVPNAILAYWVATFVPGLGLSPWPYGALQNTALLGILAALADRWISAELWEQAGHPNGTRGGLRR
jgi:O-antigen ligase